MIEREMAEKMIARLSGTLYYQQREPGAIEDLVETLRIMAEDDYEADAAMSLWLQIERECPTVADLRGVFQQLREGRPEAPARIGCERCGNAGHYMIYQLGTLQPNQKFRFEEITRPVFERLRGKLPNNSVDGRYSPERQFVMEAARKCGCGA